MKSNSLRRVSAIAAIVVMTSLVAACAHRQQEAPPPPPAPAAAPPPEAAPPPPPAAAMPPPAAAAHWMVARRARLHAAPTVHARVVATLRPGTPVEAMGPPSHGWQRVHTPAGTGWVLGRYLKPA